MYGKYMKANLGIAIALILSGCCPNKLHQQTQKMAAVHEQKLKAYFTAAPNDRSMDVSSLASETLVIADQLRAVGDVTLANKFYSYADVLLYGNHTIDESIEDVIKLVKGEKSKSKPEDKGFSASVKDFFTCDKCD